MLSFEDFCKQLNVKEGKIKDYDVLIYSNEELVPDNNVSIRKEFMSDNLYKRAMEKFYEVYLKQNKD